MLIELDDVRITAVEETEMLFRADHFLPGSDRDAIAAVDWLREPHVTAKGHLRLIVRALVVETPDTRIVVDTCFGNDKPRPYEVANMLQTDFLDRLEQAGYSRETIDIVLCTHMHLDHVGWNTMLVDGEWRPTFPNARYLFARPEFEYWSAHGEEDDKAILGDSIQPVFDAGLAELVEPDYRVDRWVRLVPTHGHTPGHVSVEIAAGDGALITGDSFHTPVQIAFPHWATSADVDCDASSATRARMLQDLAGTPTHLIGTHFPHPAVGRIERERDGYRFRFGDGGAD